VEGSQTVTEYKGDDMQLGSFGEKVAEVVVFDRSERNILVPFTSRT
jgi:hypothetical protein